MYQGSKVLHRIIYVSTASNLNENHLAGLLAQASAYNASNNVTGFLLYNDRNFLQLIEGDADRIEQLMARIELDARHNGVVRLIDEDTEIRCAPDWAMRRIVMVPSPKGRLDGLLTVLPKLDPATAKLVRNFVMLN